MSNEDYGGIYRIVNNINYKLYIGSSIHVNRRIYTHIQALNGQYHGNTHLQKAWNKYGGENFSFEIIEIINGTEEDIRKREQYWLDYYQSYNYNIGYNISHYAIGGGGYEVSDETKQKLSESHKGKVHSEETKKKMSEIKQGESNPFYGKSHTEETRMKMRTSHPSEEAPLAKLSEENVIHILKMLCSYVSISDIKNIYNISDVTIHNIKNKTRWGYLYERYPELYNFPTLPQRHSKSIKNKSGVVGVSWNKKRNNWKSVLIFDGKENYLGNFKNKDDAIKARLLAEVQYYGEYAPQKHLFNQYGINGVEKNELSQRSVDK